MNELQAVLDGIRQLWQLGEPAALATVVNVQGSAYRRPGARMLIAPGGTRQIGSVSGGCLEGDVARKAWELTEGGRAALLRYDSTADDDGLWGLGLGCQGVVEVLVERVISGDRAVEFIQSCLTRRQRGLAAMLFRADGTSGLAIGSRLLMREDGSIADDRASLLNAIPHLIDDASNCLQQGQTVVAQYELPVGSASVLLEVIEPPLTVAIFGAGWDALPLVAAAKAVGWQVLVVDRRGESATRQRFKQADEVVVCPSNEAAGRIQLDNRCAAVVMSHHFQDDLNYLRCALQSDARYVGLLGPAKRRERLLADLQERDSFTPTTSQLARLHGPVGLDIGGQNPAEIAAAIVAEILASRAGRPGGPLRQRIAPIHEPVQQIGATDANRMEPLASRR